MKTQERVNKEREQLQATEELLQHRLEIKTNERERMRRAVEERLAAKVEAIAQEWIEFDVRRAQMVLMKEARKEKQVETKILKAARAIQNDMRDRMGNGISI